MTSPWWLGGARSSSARTPRLLLLLLLLAVLLGGGLLLFLAVVRTHNSTALPTGTPHWSQLRPASPFPEWEEVTPASLERLLSKEGRTEEEHRPVLLQFYAPDCEHCINMVRTLVELVEVARQQDVLNFVYLAKVDVVKHRSLGQRYGIQEIPTIMWLPITKDLKPEVYTGSRTTGGLVAFIQEKLQDQRDWRFKAHLEGRVIVLNTFNYFHILSDAHQSYLVLVTSEGVEAPYDERLKVMFRSLADRLAGERKIRLARIALPPPEDSDSGYLKTLREKLRDVKLPAMVMYQVLPREQFKPRLERLMFLYHGKMTVENLVTFVNVVLANPGTDPNHLLGLTDRSPLSKDASAEFGSVLLSPSTLDLLLRGSNKHVIVEFFAPWCSYCQTFTPSWEKFAVTAHQIFSDVVVGTLDGSTYSETSTKHGIRGFPTIVLFTKTRKEGIFFSSKRTVRNLLQFLQKHMSEETAIPTPSQYPLIKDVQDPLQQLSTTSVSTVLVTSQWEPDARAPIMNSVAEVVQSRDIPLKPAFVRHILDEGSLDQPRVLPILPSTARQVDTMGESEWLVPRMPYLILVPGSVSRQRAVFLPYEVFHEMSINEIAEWTVEEVSSLAMDPKNGLQTLSSTRMLEKELGKQDGPSLHWVVKFHKPSCGACRAFAPVFADVSDSLASTSDRTNVMTAELDVDVNKDAIEKFGITGVPTTLLFAKGRGGKDPIKLTQRDKFGLLNAVTDEVAKLDALQQKTHTSEGAPHQQSVHVCPKARDKITGEESRHLLQLSPGYLAEKLKDPQHAALVLFVTDWCKSCPSVQKDLDTASSWFGKDPRITIGVIDADLHHSLASTYDAVRFPTLRLILPDETGSGSGKRKILRWNSEQPVTPEPLVSWVVDEVPSLSTTTNRPPTM